MRKKLRKVAAYIFRSWEDEPGYTHPGLKIFPPFLLELLTYLIVLGLLYRLGFYLWSHI